MSLSSILKKALGVKWVKRIWANLRPLFYLGHKRSCPYCNWSFSKFLPYGEELRPDASCPKCGSLERHRLLLIYLKDKTNFFKDELKVLDIAPMHCFQELCKAAPNIDYLSADIASELAMLKMDVTKIPLPDNQFDCIFCYHVLEHVTEDGKAMRELFRVLKPGGWAILPVPVDKDREETFEDPTITSPEDRSRVFGQFDHIRIYGRDYVDRLKNAGFEVTVDDYVQHLDDSVITKYGLDKDEEIYHCLKPG